MRTNAESYGWIDVFERFIGCIYGSFAIILRKCENLGLIFYGSVKLQAINFPEKGEMIRRKILGKLLGEIG